MIPTRKKPRQWLVPAVAAATIVAVPLMVFGLAGEGDRWEAARLMESYLDGNTEAAINGLAAIVERQPDNLALRTRLARWMLDNSREQEDLKLLESIPENALTSQTRKMRCDGLIATNRPQDSLELWRKFNPVSAERSQEQLLLYLNDLAYRMALAKSELPAARNHIEQVILGKQLEWNAVVKDELDFSGQVTIAATLLLRGDGSFRENGSLWHTARHRESLEKLLTPPIEEIRLMLSDPIVMAEESARFEQSGQKKDLSIKAKDRESPPDPETRLKSILSSLLTARALVYQDLGETDRSRADRKAVVELGHDPQVVADAWPSVTNCARHLMSLTAALDTRACVLYFSGAPEKAVRDLDLAIAGHEALVHGSFSVARAMGFDYVDHREINNELVTRLKRTLAAVHFHRSWVWQALADLDKAAADVRRVRELGFRPGPGLF